SQSAPVLKDTLFAAHTLGVNVKFTPIPKEQYNSWVEEQGKIRHIVTLLASKITAAHISTISGIIAGHRLNIDNITRISGRIHLDRPRKNANACVEFSFRGMPTNPERLRAEFLDAASAMGIDIALQEDNIYRSNRRLVALDMDSTLIKVEVIDELAKRAGAGEAVAAITESAMRGELDFTASLRERVRHLKGLDESVLKEIAENLPLTEGAERLMKTLRMLNLTTAIISGGFDYFGNYLKQKLGIDYVFANRLEISDGRVTGQVLGEVVDGAKKAELLEQLVRQEGISMKQVIAVGDGANDLPMLSRAGLGIAFRAKPIVRQSAEQSITSQGLDGILYLMGYRDWHISGDLG
ncbi:MAG: phosphoserine phosphatase SerB, partial [bacterium]